MKDETRIRSAAGRKVLADPRTHRYYLCLNDSENEKFLTMFEQSGMKNKAEFIFARIFGWEFKVVKIDKEAQEYYKLAEETRKLEELCKQIIELTKRFEKEYLTKKE